MEKKEEIAALEAVLFAMGDSVGLDALALSIDETEETTKLLLEELAASYEEGSRGLQLNRLEDRYQLTTRKEYYENLIRVAARPKKRNLSQAALEVLSLVAYKQPVTKLEIEKIRGVPCDYPLGRLVEYGLVEECGRLAVPGRPILFRTTESFLRFFGLSALEDLPDPDPEELEHLREEAEEEISEDSSEAEEAAKEKT